MQITGKQELRILAVLDTYPSLSETFLYTTLENLQAAGFDVIVRARRKGSAPHSRANLHDAQYLPNEQRSPVAKMIILAWLLLRFLFNSPVKSVGTLQHLWRQAANTRVYVQELYRTLPLLLIKADLTYFAFGGLAVKYLAYVKLTDSSVFSLRGSDINIEPLVNPSYRLMLVEAMVHAAGVHCVCNAIRDKAEGVARQALPHARVVYTAINPVFLENNGQRTTAASRIRIISVGRLDWRKGYEHGLMAISDLHSRGIDCCWEMIGSGPYETAIHWAIRDLGLEDVVSLTGGLDQTAIRDRLQDSDIFFHPTVSEGLSNSVLEAMATGLPVVTCDVGGMKEAVVSERNGYLVEPRNWSSMADALEVLALDVDLRQRIGQQAQEDVRHRFSLTNQQQAFAQFFAGVADSL